jgi:PDZ domain-containing secreted protein
MLAPSTPPKIALYHKVMPLIPLYRLTSGPVVETPHPVHALLASCPVWWTVASVKDANVSKYTDEPVSEPVGVGRTDRTDVAVGAHTPAPRVHWRVLLARDVSSRLLRRTAAALLLSLTGFALTLTPSGFCITRPGPVVRLDDAVSGSAVLAASQGAGWFAFTTVEVVEVSYARALVALFRGEELAKLSDDDGASTAFAQMQESVETAARLALYVKTGESINSSGVLLVDVLVGSPADKAGLRPGDVLRSVDGVFLAAPDALRAFVESNSFPALYAYERDGVFSSVRLAPRAGKIGVLAAASYGSALDGVLAVDTKNVGGSSAGLMVALAAIDALHVGDLTAGLRIAGTGTINQSGAVGPVAGVSLKFRAAIESGAEWFFVPSSLFVELEPVAGVRLYPVDTLIDALNLLCAAGATDAVCSSGVVS